MPASPNSSPSRSPPHNLFSRIAEIVERPRAFVRCDSYFGPDRRRRVIDDYAGPWRRKEDFRTWMCAAQKPPRRRPGHRARRLSPDGEQSKAAEPRAMETCARRTAVKAQVAMEAAVPPMRAAILQYVDELEEAGGDMPRCSTRSMKSAVLRRPRAWSPPGGSPKSCAATWTIWCGSASPDATIVALHASAIARAARAEDDDRMGEMVGYELAGRLARRLGRNASRP